jgi:hypothetical protein
LGIAIEKLIGVCMEKVLPAMYDPARISGLPVRR